MMRLLARLHYLLRRKAIQAQIDAMHYPQPGDDND